MKNVSWQFVLANKALQTLQALSFQQNSPPAGLRIEGVSVHAHGTHGIVATGIAGRALGSQGVAYPAHIVATMTTYGWRVWMSSDKILL